MKDSIPDLLSKGYDLIIYFIQIRVLPHKRIIIITLITLTLPGYYKKSALYTVEVEG